MLRRFNPGVLIPVKSEELLPPVSPLITLGGLLMVATVCTAINLASVIKYNVTVRANATVRPTGEIRQVQAAGEGTIKQILVKGNQMVKQGDVIAVIDDYQLQTKKSQLKGNIQQNKRQYSNLLVQIKQLDSQNLYEKLSIDRAVAVAKDDYNRILRIYRNQQITTVADVESAQAEMVFATEALKRYQQLTETGAIASLQIEEKRQAFTMTQAKLKKAKSELNPTTATIAIAEGKIVREQEQGNATIAALKKQREELIRTQVDIQKQIGNDEKEIQQLEAELKKTVILAPASGAILELKLRNPGQVVRSGDAIAKIAPSKASLIVKAKVNTEDIGKVSTCKTKTSTECDEGRANMRVSAYPYPDYGILKGSVKAVSADTIVDRANNESPSKPYYEVTIEPDKFALSKNGRDYPIQSGMEITADIISRRETALEFILRKAKLMTDI
jgi:HlyD family type I secretion membrane fusion protein